MIGQEPVLSLTGLRKTLIANDYRFELQVPELHLYRGGFYGLVGKSGSGKSTILDILAMVTSADATRSFMLKTGEGAVDLANLVRSGDDRRVADVRLRNFGYILQSGGLFSFLTVRENLELPFRLLDVDLYRPEVMQLVEQYEMSDHLDKKPSGLSGGQRQRVSILRALSLRPQIVLADEPTASVDENMAGKIVSQLKALAAHQGATVLMVSHDRDLLNGVADKVFNLNARSVGPRFTSSLLE